MIMNTEGLMIFPESVQEPFNFDTLIGSKEYATITNIPVRIDRIIRDVTKTTVLAISGTMVIRGVKVRGVWDAYGNMVECKKMLSLLSPKSMSVNLDNLFAETTSDMFRLVHMQKLE